MVSEGSFCVFGVGLLAPRSVAQTWLCGEAWGKVVELWWSVAAACGGPWSLGVVGVLFGSSSSHLEGDSVLAARLSCPGACPELVASLLPVSLLSLSASFPLAAGALPGPYGGVTSLSPPLHGSWAARLALAFQGITPYWPMPCGIAQGAEMQAGSPAEFGCWPSTPTREGLPYDSHVGGTFSYAPTAQVPQ